MKNGNGYGRSKHVGRLIAASTRVIPVVGAFGEYLVSKMVEGEIVSREPHTRNFADVWIQKNKLAIQVKMSSLHQSHRIRFTQITRLFGEIHFGAGFPLEIRAGLYALIFYRSGKTTKKSYHKSLLMSRRLSFADRISIISENLKAIHFVDVDLLNYFFDGQSEHPIVCQNGTCTVRGDHHHKYDKEHSTLKLNQTFLRSLVSDQAHHTMFDDVLGRNRWVTESFNHEVVFSGATGELSSQSIKTHFVGKTETHSILRTKIPSRTKIIIDEIEERQGQMIFTEADD